MDLDALRALVLVVETGSINQAASRLALPRTTLARRLTVLETLFGCPLLVTSRDGSVPTVAGAQLAEGAKELLSRASELESSVRLGLGNPGRRIRIWVSPGFHPDQMALGMAHCRQRAPTLRFDIQVRANPFIHGGDECPDLIVCFRRPQLGPYVIFQAIALPLTLKASPEYLRRHGSPTSLEELADHEIWAWDQALVETPGGSAVATRGGRLHPVHPVAVLNDLHQLHVMVQSGCCIGVIPSSPFDLFQPNETEVLPGLLVGETGLWVAVSDVSAAAPWMRLLIEEIRSIFVGFVEMQGGAEATVTWTPIRG